MLSSVRAGVFFVLVVSGCAVAPTEGAEEGTSGIGTVGAMDLNLAAGTMVLYEAQVRTANACDPQVGADWQRRDCQAKPAPTVTYRAEGGASCSIREDLERIRLGTLDDMMEDTADHLKGITLRYVKEKVGANTLWLMPLFPNNDRWNIPDGCDNLGSPYAVRDYLHAGGGLSRKCIAADRDEESPEPCWANDEVDQLVARAHARGLKVMFDLALNHFGHNYLMYDYAGHTPIRDRVARGENLDKLWTFNQTDEGALVRPKLLDTPAALQDFVDHDPRAQQAYEGLKAKCPGLSGQPLVRAFAMWREAFDWERQSFQCDAPSLEFGLPGFYLGSNRWDPAPAAGQNFSNHWRDVKFLFHREENRAHSWEFARVREYLFRVMNYWTSRGVDAFRLDHTTDYDSGLGSNEWKYILSKVDYYAWRRGQGKPVFLAEEFHDQMEMNKVVDIMTEGYVGDMAGRSGVTKDTAHIEGVLENMNRFGGRVFTMTALETHDESRLLEGTGFNIWTGAGFWGIGATTRSTPMLVMGQEFGEPWGVGFRRSDYLRSRFVGTSQFNTRGSDLAAYYKTMATERLRYENRALLAPQHAYLRTRATGGPDPRIFAQVKWSNDGNVVFVFHNLWEQDVAQSYFLDTGTSQALGLQANRGYRLVDVLSGTQQGPCRQGADLQWDLYVSLPAATRAQWLRLESCW